MKIGFLVNPVAGMGGAVGLKGTDGQYDRAVALGARPVAPAKARAFCAALGAVPHTFCTAAGEMGEDTLRSAGYDCETVYRPAGEPTMPADTIAACTACIAAGAGLILFCGGDGTARDIFSVCGHDIPLLGIPAGVKMYSGVFATTPAAAAQIIRRLGETSCTDAEVLDVDEEAYRHNTLATTVYGIAATPALPDLRQAAKWASDGSSDTRNQEEIARFIVEIMRPGTLYFLGAGSTTAAVTALLGLEGTLLGVDAVCDGRLVGRDLNEAGILTLLETNPVAKIVVSPIGAQGFVLGRGNQQFSPAVIHRAGVENLIVIATPAKLSRTPSLYIDTGDPDLNAAFGTSVAVISGYAMAQRIPLKI
ncbi:ATP-NAD kinase [Methanomicrobiaceae archaeon CYW5]|uniref:ATP-NAD kinase family protein n=1 Tax=Methanovulcanius yangii TaxID=1789227 RepID=UPI0029CA29C2|nr:ATP-NAD kinase family protein [Methanovulcanius yangii]MBT8508463.1 ATP-NAD kinase [Methanovulcanius yangii]